MPHSIALVVWTVPAYRTPWPEWRTSPSVPAGAAARAIGRGMHLPVSAYGHEEIPGGSRGYVARQRLAARALTRLTGRALNMRQPRGVMDPRCSDSADALQIGPTSCVCSIESGPCERGKSPNERQVLVHFSVW